jgi:hypothetical protein
MGERTRHLPKARVNSVKPVPRLTLLELLHLVRFGSMLLKKCLVLIDES